MLSTERINHQYPTLNSGRKMSTTSRNLEIHERIFSYIQTNDINRLNNILRTCLDNNRSMGYILQKLIVDRKYSLDHTTDDKELSILILKFGGPALLEILHRAKRFPSASTAYQFLNKRKFQEIPTLQHLLQQ